MVARIRRKEVPNRGDEQILPGLWWPLISRLILLEYTVDQKGWKSRSCDGSVSRISSRKRGCVLSLWRVVLLSGTIGARRGILTARCRGNLRLRIGEARNWDTLQDAEWTRRLRAAHRERNSSSFAFST